ncbi:MAG: TPM domain-containing protein [Porphyromonadaceae bacterium]|nr:TPM domain-containing protein [Porphyromonadaceae bacterium]
MLQKEELDHISASIRSAESHTSGEIRVCVARQCKGDPLNAAWKKFLQLKMEATQRRNGVLIYVSPSDHKAAIVGDKGIHDAARSDFWEDALAEMLSLFRKGLIAEGISKGVGKVGELIKAQFPAVENDVNELGDEVILEE